MADERMSDGEIRSRFEGVAERFRDMDKRLDRMAPIDMVTIEAGHLRDQIGEVRIYAKDKTKEIDQDCRERTDDVEKTAMAAVKSVADASAAAVSELKKDKQTSWSWALQVIGYGVALVAAVIAAKGIK